MMEDCMKKYVVTRHRAEKLHFLKFAPRSASPHTVSHRPFFWDNAYVMHHLYEDRQDTLPEILSMCERAGNPDPVGPGPLPYAQPGKLPVKHGQNPFKFLPHQHRMLLPEREGGLLQECCG